MVYIPNDDAQNYPFSRLKLVVKRLHTQLNNPTNQNSLQSPKFLSERIRKLYYKTLGTTNDYLPTLICFYSKVQKKMFGAGEKKVFLEFCTGI